MYRFSLPGGEIIALSDLIEVLGIIRGTNSEEKAAFESVEDFLKEVANVEFSDESLVKVTKNLIGNDWTLESLQAFETEEELTITMKNGDVVVVKVTDAQVSDANEIKPGVGYVIYSGSGENCYVLKADGTTEKVSENQLDSLGDAYRWKFSYIYQDYYTIRPAGSGSSSLSLNWQGQELVQNGNNSVRIISQRNGSFLLEGYNNDHLVFDNANNRFVGSTDAGTPVKIYGDADEKYTVRTANAAMGSVGDNAETYSAAINANGRNSGAINAVPKTGYLFDHWELNGQAISGGANLAANTLSLTNGSVLTAYFKVDDNQKGGDGKAGRVINKDYLDSWLKDLAEREFPLNKDETSKTAQVYDYENRIYQVDITTKSNVSTFNGDVDLAFIIDVSGSMLFPSKLNKVAGKENVQLTHLNDTDASKASLDQSKVYYIIADEAGTSTVYRLWFVNDHDPDNTNYPNGYWKACDASEYQLRHTDQEFRIGWGTQFSNDAADKYYQLYEDGDNGRTRQYYLQQSLSAAIQDLKDASAKLSIAADGKSPKISVAWNTFAENISKSVDFITVTKDAQVGPSGDDFETHWYTSTDRALNDAANNFNWNNIAGDQKYAILITDGAPQRNGQAVSHREVERAANNLKSKANLISVGLSMSDVIVGSELLESISSTDENGKLFYRAESGDELEYIIREIVRKIMVDAIVVGDVEDEIDKAFYPVDQNGNALNDGAKINLDGTLYTDADAAAKKPYGEIKKAENSDTYTVVWSDQDMPWEGWKGSVLVKSKEDFFGGNTINTNVAAKITPEGYKVNTGSATIPFIPADQTADETKQNLTKTVNLDTPYVNVDELRFTEHHTEVTVKLGEEVNSMAAVQDLWETIEVSEVVTKSDEEHRNAGSEDSDRNNPEKFLLKEVVDLTTQDWQDLLDGKTVTKDYDAYGHDAGKIVIELKQETKDPEPNIKADLGSDGKPKSHKTTVEGEEVEKYTLTVRYVPADPKADTDYHTTPGGDPGELTNTIESVNTHIVNVLDHSLELRKEFTGNYDFWNKQDVSFVITGPYEKDGKTEENHTYGPYRYADFVNGKLRLTDKKDGITYGTYTVSELNAEVLEEGVTLTQTHAVNDGGEEEGTTATITLDEKQPNGKIRFINNYTQTDGSYQIQITKYIVDQNGKQIGLAANTTTSFKVWRSRTARPEDVKNLNVDQYTTPYTAMLQSYTENFDALTIPVDTSGYGYDYVFKVPGGMYTIEEDPDSVQETIVDSDGNKWKYVSTHLETEYQWHTDEDTNKRHFSNQYQKDADRLIAVPEVVGIYGKNDDGILLENKVLAFFVMNVYEKVDETDSDKMNLKIVKKWQDGENTASLTSGSVIFRLHQMRTITTVDDAGKSTVTTEVDASNSGYPRSVTVTAGENWEKTESDLPFRIRVDENTTVTYSYYLEEVSRVGAAREYSDESFEGNIGGDKEHAVTAVENGETKTVTVTNARTDNPPDDKIIIIKKTWLDQYGDEPEGHPDRVLVDIYRIKLPEGSGSSGGTFNSIGGLYDVIGDPRSWKDNNNEILNDVIFEYKGEYYYVRNGQSLFSYWQLQEWDDQLDAGYMSGDHVTKLVTDKIYTDEEINAMAAANTPIRYGTVASWNGDYYVYRYTGGSFDNYAQQYGPSKSGNWSKIGKGNILDGVVITPPPNTRFVEEGEITGGSETIIGSDTTQIGEDSYIESLYEMIDAQLKGTGVEWSAEDKQLQLYLKDVEIKKEDGWTATMTAEPGYLYFFFEHAIDGYTTTYGYEEYGVYDQKQNVEIVNQTTVEDKPVDLTVEKKWKNGEKEAAWPSEYTVNYKVVQKVYLASLKSTLSGDRTGFDYSYEVDRSQFLYDNKNFTDYTVDKGSLGVLTSDTNPQKLIGLPVGKLWKPTEDELTTLTAGWTDAEISNIRNKVEAGKTYSIGYIYEIVETNVTDASGKEISFDGVSTEFDAVANKSNQENEVTLTNEITEITVRKAWTKNGQSYDENDGWFSDAKVYFTVDKVVFVDGKEVESEPVYSSKEAGTELNASNKDTGVIVSNLPVLPAVGTWTSPVEDELTDVQKDAGVQAEQTYTVSYKYVVCEDNENSTATGYTFPYAIEAERADDEYTITNDLTEIEVKKEWSGTPTSGDKVTVQLYSSTTPPAGGVSEDKVRITVTVNKWEEDETGAEVSDAPTDPNGSITVEIKDPAGKVVDSFVLTANEWSATSRELPILVGEGSGYTVAYKTADGTIVTGAKDFTDTKYNETTVVNITGVVPKATAGSDGITFGMVSWNGAGALQNTDHHLKIREFTRANGSFQDGFSPYDPDRNGSPAFGSENDHIVRKDDNNSNNNKNEIQISAVRELDSFDSGYYRFIVEKQGINYYYIRAIGGNIYFANDTDSGWPNYTPIGSRGDSVSSSTKITGEVTYIIDATVTKVEFSTEPFDTTSNSRQANFLWDDEEEEAIPMVSSHMIIAGPRKAPTLATTDRVSVTGSTNTGTSTFDVTNIAKTGQTPPSNLTPVAGTAIELDGTAGGDEYEAWRAKWSNLPTVDENGNRIYYYVVETSATKSGATSMSADYRLTDSDYITDTNGNIIGIKHLTIMNTPGEAGKISVSAHKVWNVSGGLEKDNFVVEFTLYSDEACTKIVSTTNNPQEVIGVGTATWTNLNSGTYYVKETKVSYLKNGVTTALWSADSGKPNQYLTNVDDGTDTFTNYATTYAVQKRWMTVDGQWDKDYDQTVYFHLKRDGVNVNENGVPENKVFTLTKSTNADGVVDVDNLYIMRFPLLPGGEYTVVECTSGGNDLSQEATANDNTGKSHKLCAETVELTDGSDLDVTAIKNDLYHIKAMKEWAESGVAPMYYPAVTFILKRTTDAVTDAYDWTSVAEYKTASLSAMPASASEAERTVDFGKMPRFDENSNEYTYKVFEQPIEGYVASTSVESVADGIQTFTITNTPKTMDLYVHKNWFESGENANKDHEDDIIAYDVYRQAYTDVNFSKNSKIGDPEKIALPEGVTGRLPIAPAEEGGNYGWQETVAGLPTTGAVERDKTLGGKEIVPVYYKYYVVETAFGSFTTEYYVEGSDEANKSETAADHSVGGSGNKGLFIRNNMTPVDFSIEKTEKGNTSKKLPGAKFSVQEIDETDPKLPLKADSTAKEGTTNENGLVTFKELTTGIYKVTELQSPDGYIMTGDNFFYIQVAKGKVSVVELNEKTGEWQKRDDSAMLRYNPNSSTAIVANEPGVALPNSGGIGTNLFYILGSVLILGAGLLLWRRRRLI